MSSASTLQVLTDLVASVPAGDDDFLMAAWILRHRDELVELRDAGRIPRFLDLSPNVRDAINAGRSSNREWDAIMGMKNSDEHPLSVCSDCGKACDGQVCTCGADCPKHGGTASADGLPPSPRRRGRRRHPVTRDDVQREMEHGQSQRAAAETLGVTHATVRRRLAEPPSVAGVDPADVIRRALAAIPKEDRARPDAPYRKVLMAHKEVVLGLLEKAPRISIVADRLGIDPRILGHWAWAVKGAAARQRRKKPLDRLTRVDVDEARVHIKGTIAYLRSEIANKHKELAELQGHLAWWERIEAGAR